MRYCRPLYSSTISLKITPEIEVRKYIFCVLLRRRVSIGFVGHMFFYCRKMRSSWSFTFNSPVFFLKNTFEFAFHTARSAFAGGVFMEKGIESKNFHKIYLVVQWVGEVVSNRRCVVQILHSNLSFFFLSFLLLFCFAGIFVFLLLFF